MNDQQLATSLRMAALMPAYLRNTISDADREELEQWLAASDSNRRAMEELLNADKAGREWRDLAYYKQRTEAANGKVLAKIGQRPSRHIQLYRAAAVAALLISAVAFIWLSREQKTAIPAQSIYVADILPGSQKAKLVLSNGESLALDQDADTSFMQGASVKVQQQQGLLAYQDFDAGTDDIQFHQLITPNGGEYHLQLEDGTHVWLNAASSLRFPTRFSGNERRVQLTGEAYFEVAKDAKHPFIVDVQDRASVEVLGTHFNINAYTDEENIHTTLLEGAVAVATASDRRRIAPGQQAVVRPDAGHPIIVGAADTVRAIAWKNGVFDFNDAKLTEVMRQVSRWYDIQVVYEQGVPDIRVWGRMKRNQNLQQLIRILNGMDVKARLENRKLIVMP